MNSADETLLDQLTTGESTIKQHQTSISRGLQQLRCPCPFRAVASPECTPADQTGRHINKRYREHLWERCSASRRAWPTKLNLVLLSIREQKPHPIHGPHPQMIEARGCALTDPRTNGLEQ